MTGNLHRDLIAMMEPWIKDDSLLLSVVGTMEAAVAHAIEADAALSNEARRKTLAHGLAHRIRRGEL